MKITFGKFDTPCHRDDDRQAWIYVNADHGITCAGTKLATGKAADALHLPPVQPSQWDEAMGYLAAKGLVIVGTLTSVKTNVGDGLCPRYVVTSYVAEIWDDACDVVYEKETRRHNGAGIEGREITRCALKTAKAGVVDFLLDLKVEQIKRDLLADGAKFWGLHDSCYRPYSEALEGVEKACRAKGYTLDPGAWPRRSRDHRLYVKPGRAHGLLDWVMGIADGPWVKGHDTVPPRPESGPGCGDWQDGC